MVTKGGLFDVEYGMQEKTYTSASDFINAKRKKKRNRKSELPEIESFNDSKPAELILNGNLFQQYYGQSKTRETRKTKKMKMMMEQQKAYLEIFSDNVVPLLLTESIEEKSLENKMEIVKKHVQHWIHASVDISQLDQQLHMVINIYYPRENSILLDDILIAFLLHRPEVYGM